MVEPFRDFGTATISSGLREICGILRHYLVSPVAFTPGKKMVGTAVTLSFLPKCEDIVVGHQEEEQESRSALWSAVIATQAGDMLVVNCRIRDLPKPGNWACRFFCLAARRTTRAHPLF